MKFGKYLAFIAALAILSSLNAFARDKNQGNLRLFEPAQIGTTQLQPGNYKVEWTGNGSDVQVNVLKDKQTVATTTGQLKTLGEAVSQDTVVTQPTENNNARQIVEIDFGSHKQALILSPSQSTQARGQ